MINEIWVWYDETEGDVPLVVKACEVTAFCEGTFVGTYFWREVHENGGPWGVPGLFVRPRWPDHWTIGRLRPLLEQPGVRVIEVRGVNFLSVGDGQVRKHTIWADENRRW